MLVLSRKQNQQIIIGNEIKITILKIRGNSVRLGIEAPRHVHVLRGELPTESGVTVEFKTDELDGTNSNYGFRVFPNQSASSESPPIISHESEPDSKSIDYDSEHPTAASTTEIPVSRLREIIDNITSG